MITKKIFARTMFLAYEMDIVKGGFNYLFLEDAYQQAKDRFGDQPYNPPMPYLEVAWMRLGQGRPPVEDVGATRRHCLMTRGQIPNRFRRTS